jgi:hypothetical protein
MLHTAPNTECCGGGAQEAARDAKSSVLAGVRAQKAALEAKLAEADAARGAAEAEVCAV